VAAFQRGWYETGQLNAVAAALADTMFESLKTRSRMSLGRHQSGVADSKDNGINRHELQMAGLDVDRLFPAIDVLTANRKG
jgi:hypothetical protein